MQPAVLGDSDVLIGTGMSVGTRRIRISRDGSSLATKQVWSSTKFKPYFNDFVVHKDHAYGFDTGPSSASAWKTARRAVTQARLRADGQVLLTADQDLLLDPVGTRGIALVQANPEKVH